MNSERIQTVIHKLETGAGPRLLWSLVVALLVMGLGVLYDLYAYHGFSDPEAMDVAQVARNLAGLSGQEALRTLRMCVLSRGRADAGLLDDVLDAKRQALRSEGLIETVRRDTSFGDVAGLQRDRKSVV